MDPVRHNATRTKRPLVRVAIAVVLGLVVLLLSAPHIVARSSLRNRLLKSLVNKPDILVTSRAASFGWLSPMIIDGLELRSSDGKNSVKVERLSANKTWHGLLRSWPNLGAFEVERPRVEVVVDEPWDDATDARQATHIQGAGDWPNLSAKIHRGELLVSETSADEAAIDVAEVDLSLQISSGASGTILKLDPIVMVDNQTVTAETIDQGLKLVAPVLSDEVEIEGAYSFELTNVEISLDKGLDDKATAIEGVATFHQVNAQLKNQVTYHLAALATEMMGLGRVPQRLRLVENAQFAFRWKEGRVHHESMVLALPEISSGLSIQTQGSVGLDEDLDLEVQLQLPLAELSTSQLARELASAPATLRVTGTIDTPKLDMPVEQPWVSTISERLAMPDLSRQELEFADRIIELIADLIDLEAAMTSTVVSEAFRKRLEPYRRTGASS